jgi:hypothetical protein
VLWTFDRPGRLDHLRRRAFDQLEYLTRLRCDCRTADQLAAVDRRHNLTRSHATMISHDRPADIEGEEGFRPRLVFFCPPAYGCGLCPEFDRGIFQLAVFIDPTVPHWVEPLASPVGTMAYKVEGPTRGGGTERITVTRDDGGFHCTCGPYAGCDHTRALVSLGLFHYRSAPYDHD